MEDKKKKDKIKFYQHFFIAFFIFFIIACALFLQFSFSIRKVEESYNYVALEQFTAQNRENLKERFHVSMQYLQNLSEHFSLEQESVSSGEIEEWLQKDAKNTLFTYVGLANAAGKAETTTGQNMDVSQEVFFQKAMAGEAATSPLLEHPLLGEAEFVNAVPIYEQGGIAGVLYGAYDVSILSETLSGTAVQLEFDFAVITKEGRFVYLPQQKEAFLQGDNFWKILEKSVPEKGSSVEQMYQEIQENKTNMRGYTWDREKRYFYYAPYGSNDWYAVSILNPLAMEKKLRQTNHMVHRLSIEILVVFIVVMLLMIHWDKKSRKEILQMAKQLQQNEKSIAVAVAQGEQAIFEYDIDTKVMTFLYDAEKKYGFSKQVLDVPESLIQQNIVVKESAEDFRRLFQMICEGEETVSSLVRMKKRNGQYAWDMIKLSNIFNEAGERIQTVGSIEDATEQKESERQIAEEVELRKAMVSDAMASYEVNITKNYMMRRNAEEINEFAEPKKWYSYTKCSQGFIEKLVFSEDRVDMMKTFSRENLAAIFQKGQREVKKEYRQKTAEGNYIWVECAIHLLQDSISGDIKGFLVLRNIDQQKKRDLWLQQQADMDFLTNIYNRATTERLIQKSIQERVGKEIHAFLLVDLDNFKAINDTLGHQMGDTALVDTAEVLKQCFRKTDVVGRLGGDEFIVLMESVTSIESVKRSAGEIIKRLDRYYGTGEQRVRTTASVGIAIAPDHGNEFQTLYEKADKALYFVKQNGKNGFAVYGEEKEV